MTPKIIIHHAPDFEVYDEDLLAVIKQDAIRSNQKLWCWDTLNEAVRDAKKKAYLGYIANALDGPDGYPDTTIPALINLATEWAESDWEQYLS